MDTYETIIEMLKVAGFTCIDTTPDGQDIYRKDDQDIIIELINHNDGL